MCNLKNLTEPECCKMAIDVQNACNIGGVSNDFHKLIVSIREIKGQDYKYADHPAVIVYLDKLHDMLRVPFSQRTEQYGDAYSKCKEIALAAGLKIYE